MLASGVLRWHLATDCVTSPGCLFAYFVYLLGEKEVYFGIYVLGGCGLVTSGRGEARWTVVNHLFYLNSLKQLFFRSFKI
jgi:hypothetical protein